MDPSDSEEVVELSIAESPVTNANGDFKVVLEGAGLIINLEVMFI
jgi:hypothetical protein